MLFIELLDTMFLYMYKHFRIGFVCTVQTAAICCFRNSHLLLKTKLAFVIQLHGGTINAWRTVISLQFVDDVPVMYANEYALHSTKGSNRKASAPVVKVHRQPKT